jgi:hypothetical protein
MSVPTSQLTWCNIPEDFKVRFPHAATWHGAELRRDNFTVASIEFNQFQ